MSSRNLFNSLMSFATGHDADETATSDSDGLKERDIIVLSPDGTVALGVPDDDACGGNGHSAHSDSNAAGSGPAMLQGLLRLRDALNAAELIHTLVAVEILDQMREREKAKMRCSKRRSGYLLLVDASFWILQYVLAALVLQLRAGDSAKFEDIISIVCALGNAVLAAIGLWGLHRDSIAWLNLYLLLGIGTTVILVRLTQAAWLFLILRSASLLTNGSLRISYHKQRMREQLFQRSRKANSKALRDLAVQVDKCIDYALTVDTAAAERQQARQAAAAAAANGGDAAAAVEAPYSALNDPAQQRLNGALTVLRNQISSFRPADYSAFTGGLPLASVLGQQQQPQQNQQLARGPGRPPPGVSGPASVTGRVTPGAAGGARISVTTVTIEPAAAAGGDTSSASGGGGAPRRWLPFPQSVSVVASEPPPPLQHRSGNSADVAAGRDGRGEGFTAVNPFHAAVAVATPSGGVVANPLAAASAVSNVGPPSASAAVPTSWQEFANIRPAASANAAAASPGLLASPLAAMRQPLLPGAELPPPYQLAATGSADHIIIGTPSQRRISVQQHMISHDSRSEEALHDQLPNSVAHSPPIQSSSSSSYVSPSWPLSQQQQQQREGATVITVSPLAGAVNREATRQPTSGGDGRAENGIERV